MDNTLVTAYSNALPVYEQQREAVVALLGDVLGRAGLKIHHLTARVKRPASLADKLRRKPGRYRVLEDLTDLVGVRVITYFESDVAVVSRLLEDHFEVDWANSVDKGKVHDPDRFGYMGVHYVLRVPPGPGAVLPGLRFEVQIRSILQHAWAEIEHDLGYKNREAVPREVRRRFNRLSGLLEMADEEFMALHRLSRDYAADLPQRVLQAPDSVYIDAQSMKHLLSVAPVRDLDTAVSDALKVRLLVGWPDPDRPQRLARLLHYVGVHSVGLLQKELRRHEGDIVRFAELLLPRLRESWLPAGGARPGVSVVHYALLKVCAAPGLNATDVAALIDIGTPGYAERFVQAVSEAYGELRQTVS
ncbi:GTP pyrophosphokinase [Deinococcus malanensis]|uniref:GTP pyrophosphokinase n=1 Tax=Deinococcus malanensis TaxID=1706855 RepID=A0ABQ2EK43_9DEIO|nr:GTP pyrophosphokinase family protein [Deinococcus malanensis]GGK14142.1 GTP pyrophosphokinase [Deinococcus malanensis]